MIVLPVKVLQPVTIYWQGPQHMRILHLVKFPPKKVVTISGGSKRGTSNAHLSQSKFFHFHAVFCKNFAKQWIGWRIALGNCPLGNSGSTTDQSHIQFFSQISFMAKIEASHWFCNRIFDLLSLFTFEDSNRWRKVNRIYKMIRKKLWWI